jgi:hypothetical protein
MVVACQCERSHVQRFGIDEHAEENQMGRERYEHGHAFAAERLKDGDGRLNDQYAWGHGEGPPGNIYFALATARPVAHQH